MVESVYEDVAVHRSTVSRWARRLCGEIGRANIRDSPRTSRPHIAQTSKMYSVFMEIMPQGTTFNYCAYVANLKKLQA